MQIGHIGTGCYCGDKPGQIPGDLINKVAPETPRPDVRTPRGDEVSLTRRASSILASEIRQVLSSAFNFSFKASPGYGDEAAARGSVALDVRAVGRALLAASPLGARDYLGALRQKVQDAADATRNVVGGNPSDINGALGQIEDGLSELDGEASRNVASSASVLSYESQLSRRSVIRIRTQEGDVVRLDLRQRESIEASDVSVNDGNVKLTETEIDISSRSRMSLKVKGDINEAEMAAIKSVVSQAVEAADEFYGGDVAAAFDELSGMEFDADQLSGVKVRFRERIETNLSFAAIQRFEPAPIAAPPPAADPRTEIPEVKSVPLDIVKPEAEELAPPAKEPEVGRLAGADPDRVAPVILEPAVPATPAANPIEGLLDLLADFINSTNRGFEQEGGTSRFFYSESFKLQLLKSVLDVAAPDESRGSTEAASKIIDAVTEPSDND